MLTAPCTDALDTMLGDLAVDEELTFTIVIKTTATESSNPYDDSGITPPQTGDNSNLWLWFALLFVSGAGVFGITLNERKRRTANKR